MTRETKVGLLLALSFVVIFGLVVANKWRSSDDAPGSTQAKQDNSKKKKSTAKVGNNGKKAAATKPPSGIVPVKFVPKNGEVKPPAKHQFDPISQKISELPPPVAPMEITPVPPSNPGIGKVGPKAGIPPPPEVPPPYEITKEQQEKMQNLLAQAQKESKGKKNNFVPPPPPPIPELPSVDDPDFPLPMPVGAKPKPQPKSKDVTLPKPGNLGVKNAKKVEKKNKNRPTPPVMPSIDPPEVPNGKPTAKPNLEFVPPAPVAPNVNEKTEAPPPLPTPTPSPNAAKPTVKPIPKQNIEFKPAKKEVRPDISSPPEKHDNQPTITIRPKGPKPAPVAPAPKPVGKPAVTPKPNVAPMGSPAPFRTTPITIEQNPSTPLIQVIDVESHSVRNGDSLALISNKYYSTDRYVEALVRFNREHPLGDEKLSANANLRPGQTLYIPPPYVLDRFLNGAPSNVKQKSVQTKPMAIPVVSPSPLQPNNPVPVTLNPTVQPNEPAANQWIGKTKTEQYRVSPGGEWMFDIARKTLGDGKRWNEIYRLNSQLRPEFRIPAGTVVNVPVGISKR